MVNYYIAFLLPYQLSKACKKDRKILNYQLPGLNFMFNFPGSYNQILLCSYIFISKNHRDSGCSLKIRSVF